MKKRTILIVTLVALALIVSAVGITMAYLTDTDSVTNTFTVGDLEITLTEPNWTADKGTANIPGDTLLKDPTVLAEDNDCYVRFVVSFIDTTTGAVITDSARCAKIAQTIRYDSTYNTSTGAAGTKLLESASYSTSQLSSIPSVNPAFTLDSTLSTAGTKYYNGTSALSENGKITLFTNIVIPTDWDNADMALLGSYKIKVTAQAIQADNFADANAAFAALNTKLAG